MDIVKFKHSDRRDGGHRPHASRIPVFSNYYIIIYESNWFQLRNQSQFVEQPCYRPWICARSLARLPLGAIGSQAKNPGSVDILSVELILTLPNFFSPLINSFYDYCSSHERKTTLSVSPTKWGCNFSTSLFVPSPFQSRTLPVILCNFSLHSISIPNQEPQPSLCRWMYHSIMKMTMFDQIVIITSFTRSPIFQERSRAWKASSNEFLIWFHFSFLIPLC